jgi:hypothetical protein
MRGEALQAAGPDALAAERLAQALKTVAVAVEVPVLEVDARAVRALGREPHHLDPWTPTAANAVSICR